jgi:hypothetical protein
VGAASVQAHVLPHLGNRRVLSSTIKALASCLQEASRLYDLDLPLSVSVPGSIPASSPPSTLEENLLAANFGRQLHESVEGTTAEIVPRPRERFAYCALDLLFALCDRRTAGEYDPDHNYHFLFGPSQPSRAARFKSVRRNAIELGPSP